MDNLHRAMGQRSHHRSSRYYSAALQRTALLPLRRLQFAPLVAGLSLMVLATGCDRTTLEQVFAPDPQLVGKTETGDASSSGTSASSNNGSKSKPSTSTPPGGAASGSSKTQPSAGSSSQTSPGGSRNPGLAGHSSTDASGSTENKPATTTAQSTGDRTDDAQTSSDPLGTSGSIPIELESSVADVLALGVLTPPDQAAVDGDFEPNEPVTRGDFARWLLAANNAVYGDRPAAQIRSATGNSEPTFKDVPKNNPNFPAIQGLAEAGIIPSGLSGAQEQINFKPDAPLTREDMLLWKVPLDARQTLPASNLEAVKEAWGFQDASKASAPALRAILADYSNGDQAVIRRVFGYTTLLQPQKTVTQAEAAAALWYFGNSGQGISAGDVSVGDLGEGDGNENIGG